VSVLALALSLFMVTVNPTGAAESEVLSRVQALVFSLPHHAHATLADFLDEVVMQQLLSGFDRHSFFLPLPDQILNSNP